MKIIINSRAAEKALMGMLVSGLLLIVIGMGLLAALSKVCGA